MRNADQNRSRSRRRRVILGVAGVVSVFGTSAFLASGQTDAGPEAGAPVPAPAAAQQAVPETDQGGGAPANEPARQMGPAVEAAGPNRTPNTAERLDKARTANERLGTTVRRPRERPATNVNPAKVRTVETGTLKKDRRTLRIVSSRQDLTGFRELGWVGDEGVPYGKARCSRTIQISDKPPAEKPTLMMCWRNTSKKSVYTILVDLRRSPTPQEGVAALSKEWKRMG